MTGAISHCQAIPKPRLETPSLKAAAIRRRFAPPPRINPPRRVSLGPLDNYQKEARRSGTLGAAGHPCAVPRLRSPKSSGPARIPRLAAPLALENPARPCPVVRTISVIRKGSTPLPQAPPVGPETSRCAHVRCAHSYVCMLCRQGLANRGVCNALPCRVGAPRGGHVSLGMTRGTAGATPGKNLIQSIYKNIMKAYIKQEETKREDRWSCPDVGGTNEAI